MLNSDFLSLSPIPPFSNFISKLINLGGNITQKLERTIYNPSGNIIQKLERLNKFVESVSCPLHLSFTTVLFSNKEIYRKDLSTQECASENSKSILINSDFMLSSLKDFIPI